MENVKALADKVILIFFRLIEIEMKEIGTVISSLEGPTSSEFSFVIKNATSEIPIRKNQFVQLNTEEGLLIARVSEVMKTNRYFMRPEAVSEYEKSGRPLMELFPVDKWEYLVANAVSIGIYSENGQKRVSYPPSPGQKVFQVEEKILADFLGLDQKGLEIGRVHFHDLNMKINLTRLFQKHAAILARTGFGKSHLVSVLIEEILSRPEEYGKPALVVVDPHGEYSSFSRDPSFMEKTKVFDLKNISLNTSTLSAKQICEFQPFISSVERRELSKIIEKLRKEKSSFDLEMVINEIENSEINPRSKAPLVSWLEELNSSKLFRNYDSPDIGQFVQSGQLSILDLSDFIHLRERQIIMTYFARKIFNSRRSGKVCPVILFVEEAHQFCLSEDTEILTTNGWKKYNEIKVGNYVFSYKNETNELETNPIEKIIIKKHEGELIKLHNQDSMDSLVTGDHRVLCYTRTTDKNRKWKWSKPRFIFAKSLPTGIKIPVTGQIVSTSNCDIDTDLIKILGWIITDGYLHFFDKKRYSCYEISQSKSKGDILKEMKEVIKRRFPESKIYSRKRKGRFYNSRYIRGTEEFIFHLGKKATEEIKKWLRDKTHIIPRRFIEKASLNQLKILFEALVQGDGNVYFSKNKYRYITFYVGHDSNLADDFQELCIRLGLSAVRTKSTNNQIKVLVSFKRKFAYVRKITKEYFSGRVWDITVKNGAFVARRNGKVFITGNCPEGIEREGAISRSVIEQISREGRKFNCCLVLISQRPIQLSTTALSQCNSQIILRVSNPYDIDHIGRSCEGVTQDILKMLPGLKVGEALISGEAVHHPLLIQIKDRKSKKSEKGKSFEEAIISFKNEKENSKKDLEAFT